MALSIQGKFKAAAEIQRLGEGGSFLKRLFWVDLSANGYTNMAEFQLLHDSVTDVDGLKEGDEIEVSFYLKGGKRKYKTASGVEKEGFFQHLQAYKLSRINRQTIGSTLNTAPSTAPMPTVVDGGDDLPF